MKEGDIYRYRYHTQSRWACHGMFIVHEVEGQKIAVDTYEGLSEVPRGMFANIVALDRVGEIEFLGNINDFRPASEDEFHQFADEDQLAFPAGRISSAWYVRKDKTRDPRKTKWFYENKISSASSAIVSAQYRLSRWEKEMKEFLDSLTGHDLASLEARETEEEDHHD